MPNTVEQPTTVLPAERRAATVSKWLGIALLCLSVAPSRYAMGDVPQFYIFAEYTENLFENAMVLYPPVAGLLLLALGFLPRVDRGAWFLLLGLAPFCLSPAFTASAARSIYPVLPPFGGELAPNLLMGLTVWLAIVILTALWRLRLVFSAPWLKRFCGILGGIILLCGVIAFWHGNTLMCYLMFGNGAAPLIPEGRPEMVLLNSLRLWGASIVPETLGALGLLSAFAGGRKLFGFALFLGIVFLIFPLASALVEVIIYFRMTYLENALLKNSLVDLFQFGRTLVFMLLLWTGLVILVAKRLWIREGSHGRT